jgi:hypothetical protein
MRTLTIISALFLGAFVAVPLAAADPKCSFNENELQGEMIVYLDSGMACEADESQRAAQQDALTAYYVQLEKIVSASSAADTSGSATQATASARSQPNGAPKRDLDAMIAAGGGQFVSKDLLTAAMRIP